MDFSDGVVPLVMVSILRETEVKDRASLVNLVHVQRERVHSEISALVEHGGHLLANVSDARIQVLKVRLRLLNPVVVLGGAPDQLSVSVPLTAVVHRLFGDSQL